MLHRDLETDFDTLRPGRSTEAGASRRTTLKAALGVGYSALALPLNAQMAIKTSSEGLSVGEITYKVNGFKVPAYRAAPANQTNLPVVLVIHEIFGVHE
jgi:carboxymethylenebutenolidase